VARPELLDLIDTGANHPLTAVVAPPGAGKTVLLAAWAHERCPTARWIQCRPADADPHVLLARVATVLRAGGEDAWIEVAELLQGPDTDHDVVVDALLDALAEHPTVVVLDDVHLARDASRLLSRLVDGLPEGSRLLAGSRGESPFELHRLRALGRCVEVRDADLRLSGEHVASLLAALGARVSPEAAAALADRTDGWAAGVQMAAIALRNEDDHDRFVNDFSGTVSIVSDFLVAEVLAAQAPEVQEFLLWTSVLDEMDPWVCGAVTERGGAGAMLRELEAAALFVVRTGNDTYRYHHLFRDMLRYQLRANDPATERIVHGRAASWYREQNDLVACLRHLVAAGEDEQAFELLGNELVNVYLRDVHDGTTDILERVDAVGGLDRTSDPGRMVAIAAALAAAGAMELAERWVERAERVAHELSPELRARFAVAKAYVARERGELDVALQLLATAAADESADDLVIAVPYYQLINQVWLGDMAAAHASVARTRTLRPLGVIYNEIIVGGTLAWGECAAGQLRAAARLTDTALATAAEHELLEHPALIEPLRARGRLLFEHGNLDAAEAAIERSLSIAEKRRPAQALLSAVSLARVWLSQGRLTDAAEALASARRFVPVGSHSPLLGYVDAMEARLALDEGDLARAEALVARIGAGPRRARLSARLRLRRQEPERALVALDEQPPTTAREVVDDLLLRALCAHELHASDATEVLAASIDAARPEGYSFAVAEDLFPIAGRVGALLRERPLDDFATSALALQDTIVRPEPGPRSTLVEPLTDRELTVLRYLDTRMMHAEIARDLFVSVNTVKTHNKAIYRKLAVGSRQEAVAEARRLGIR